MILVLSKNVMRDKRWCFLKQQRIAGRAKIGGESNGEREEARWG